MLQHVLVYRVVWFRIDRHLVVVNGGDEVAFSLVSLTARSIVPGRARIESDRGICVGNRTIKIALLDLQLRTALVILCACERVYVRRSLNQLVIIAGRTDEICFLLLQASPLDVRARIVR